MARCPFGPHRLLIGEGLACKRCGADLRFYVAVRDLHLSYYNEARRVWDESKFEEAAAWLQAALKLRPDFAEAHWLLGAVEARRGRIDCARHHLTRAQEMGANTGDWQFALSAQGKKASEEAIESGVAVSEEEFEMAINQSIVPQPDRAKPLRTFLVRLKNFFSISMGREDDAGQDAYADKSAPERISSGAIADSLPEAPSPRDVSTVEDVSSSTERDIAAQSVN